MTAAELEKLLDSLRRLEKSMWTLGDLYRVANKLAKHFPFPTIPAPKTIKYSKTLVSVRDRMANEIRLEVSEGVARIDVSLLDCSSVIDRHPGFSTASSYGDIAKVLFFLERLPEVAAKLDETAKQLDEKAEEVTKVVKKMRDYVKVFLSEVGEDAD